MKRNRTRRLALEDAPGVDISSLIDVCFLLLIYFLVTSTIVKKEQDLDMFLGTEYGDYVPTIPLVLEIEKSGRLITNPDEAPEVMSPAGGGSKLERLVERLHLLKVANGNAASVQLRVAKDVDYQRFIDVINALAGEEVANLAVVDL